MRSFTCFKKSAPIYGSPLYRSDFLLLLLWLAKISMVLMFHPTSPFDSRPKSVSSHYLLTLVSGENGLLPLFKKILAQYSCFEIIKHRVSVLKLDLKKIELQVELDISNVEFYAYFAI